ncbi:MAG: hypothetical protein ACTSUE_02310, partial [Promethearchaeota archaeon]
MTRDKFLSLIRRFATYRKGHEDTWLDDLGQFFFNEAARKWRRYPSFTKRVKHVLRQVDEVNARGEGITNERGTYEPLFQSKIPAFIKDWLTITLNVPGSAIRIENTRIVYAREVLIKGEFKLGIETLQQMESIANYTGLSGGPNERELIRVIFESIFKALNMCFKRDVESPWRTRQISNLFQLSGDEVRISFIVSVNNYMQKNLPERYFKANLLNFLEDKLDFILDDRTRLKLVGREAAMTVLNREFYYRGQDEVIGTIKHFRELCLLTGKIYHIFDILAFLISRLDLSIFSIQDILRMYSKENNLDEKQELVSSYLIETLTEQALLHATFQANYTGLKDKVGQVLMIILQYYLIDLDVHVLSEKVFNGNNLSDNIDRLAGNEAPGKGKGKEEGKGEGKEMVEKFKAYFQEFLIKQFMLVGSPAYRIYIQGIFGRSIDNLVFRFFTSFLKTSDLKI